MVEKTLKDFLVFLEKEGLISKPLDSKKIVDKFLNQATASQKIKAPEGYAGFSKGT